MSAKTEQLGPALSRWLLALSMCGGLALLAGGGCAEEPGEGDGDGDTDADTDADSDADGDVDSDVDSDADVDGDVDSDSDVDTDVDSDVDGDSDSDADGDSDPPEDGEIVVDESCAGFIACGGALAGTSWAYRSVCIEEGFLFGELETACPGSSVLSSEGWINGTVAFTADRVERHAEGEVTTIYAIPSSCSIAMAGCSFLESTLGGLGVDATCVDGEARACDCTVVTPYDVSQASTYVIEGGTLLTGDGGTYEFCVDGATLTYADGGEDPEPGVGTLAAR